MGMNVCKLYPRLAHKSSSKFFSSAKRELEICYVFGGKARERTLDYYRNRKREAKDFEKVVVVSKHMTKFYKVLFDRVTGRFDSNSCR